ncbi:tubulin epsilon and delta complex protein 1 isoform X2 [Dunckerocampus dactyliophorus]|uniref:tubulin epsilon and delta complex protein 1 isoform X2 n=1 Tax=Dunckerocampus dactyliophorus TaxID=161453 RepID=UPI0024063224|nr:tubulin epsilon and delta complex protein 1 isoform X2 [Dunckerocampus dactyliophorus]
MEVKGAVGTLCRLLAAVGLQHVPTPSTFRRAKFGEVDVEDQFWQLLANILQTTKTVSSVGSAQMQNASGCRKLVSAGLWQSGYYAGWMYGKEEEGVSSRELLLALGWQLASGIMEKLLTQRVQQLDTTVLTPTVPEVKYTDLKRLQWLIGFLRHQGQVLLSMQDEQALLLHAVYSAGASRLPESSSSSGQSCTVLSESCVGVQELCDLLELYLNWKKAETVFWTWMDSVEICHVKDAVTERPTHTLTKRAAACPPGRLCADELEGIRSRLTTVQLMSQKGLKAARGDTEDRGERLEDSSETYCDKPPFLSLSTPLALSQAYRARFQAQRPVKHHSCPAEGRGQNAKELSASQVVELLHEIERQLLKRRDTQRLTNRMQLQQMIGKLDELVLIPP